LGVTITWAISCGLESSSSSSSCSKQPTTGRYFPRPYYYPPPTRKAGLWLPLTRNCLYSLYCLEGFFPVTRFPPNTILGNSEVPRHGTKPWSLSFAGALALHVCTTIIRVGLDYEQTAERSSSKWLM